MENRNSKSLELITNKSTLKDCIVIYLGVGAYCSLSLLNEATQGIKRLYYFTKDVKCERVEDSEHSFPYYRRTENKETDEDLATMLSILHKFLEL